MIDDLDDVILEGPPDRRVVRSAVDQTGIWGKAGVILIPYFFSRRETDIILAEIQRRSRRYTPQCQPDKIDVVLFSHLAEIFLDRVRGEIGINPILSTMKPAKLDVEIFLGALGLARDDPVAQGQGLGLRGGAGRIRRGREGCKPAKAGQDDEA